LELAVLKIPIYLDKTPMEFGRCSGSPSLLVIII